MWWFDIHKINIKTVQWKINKQQHYHGYSLLEKEPEKNEHLTSHASLINCCFKKSLIIPQYIKKNWPNSRN